MWRAATGAGTRGGGDVGAVGEVVGEPARQSISVPCIDGRAQGPAVLGHDNKTDLDRKISAQYLILNWADQNAK